MTSKVSVSGCIFISQCIHWCILHWDLVGFKPTAGDAPRSLKASALTSRPLVYIRFLTRGYHHYSYREVSITCDQNLSVRIVYARVAEWLRRKSSETRGHLPPQVRIWQNPTESHCNIAKYVTNPVWKRERESASLWTRGNISQCKIHHTRINETCKWIGRNAHLIESCHILAKKNLYSTFLPRNSHLLKETPGGCSLGKVRSDETLGTDVVVRSLF